MSTNIVPCNMMYPKPLGLTHNLLQESADDLARKLERAHDKAELKALLPDLVKGSFAPFGYNTSRLVLRDVFDKLLNAFHLIFQGEDSQTAEAAEVIILHEFLSRTSEKDRQWYAKTPKLKAIVHKMALLGGRELCDAGVCEVLMRLFKNNIDFIGDDILPENTHGLLFEKVHFYLRHHKFEDLKSLIDSSIQPLIKIPNLYSSFDPHIQFQIEMLHGSSKSRFDDDTDVFYTPDFKIQKWWQNLELIREALRAYILLEPDDVNYKSVQDFITFMVRSEGRSVNDHNVCAVLMRVFEDNIDWVPSTFYPDQKRSRAWPQLQVLLGLTDLDDGV